MKKNYMLTGFDWSAIPAWSDRRKSTKQTLRGYCRLCQRVNSRKVKEFTTDEVLFLKNLIATGWTLDRLTVIAENLFRGGLFMGFELCEWYYAGIDPVGYLSLDASPDSLEAIRLSITKEDV